MQELEQINAKHRGGFETQIEDPDEDSDEEEEVYCTYDRDISRVLEDVKAVTAEEAIVQEADEASSATSRTPRKKQRAYLPR